MNYQTWSKRRFYLVLVGAFLLGGIFHGISTQPVQTPTIRTVTVEKPVAQKADYSKWQQLKALDDRAFITASEALSICGSGYTALDDGARTGNYTKLSKDLDAVITGMTTKSQEVDQLVAERNALLKDLGY